MYPKEITLANIGITKAREAKILQVIAESYSVPQSNPEATRKRLEAFVQETRASETVAKAISQVHQRQKEDSKLMYRQITETFEPTPDSIWEEIDILEGDPAHRGMSMRNARFKPFWLTAEASEPKLELLMPLRHVLLYEVSRWRKGRTIFKISLPLPA